MDNKIPMDNKILIVEDEPDLAKLLRDYLLLENFQVDIISHGDQVDTYLCQHQPDLIVLDLMLPGKDGLTICREIRQESSLPIIMTTAKIEEIDRLIGLELGADDYICKPYSPREVVARIKAVLRRSQHFVDNEQKTRGGQKPFELDEQAWQVRIYGKDIALTAVEFQIVKLLSSRPGQIFSRHQLMDNIYPDRRIVSDRTIDSHIRKIRKKISQGLMKINNMEGKQVEINTNHEWISSIYGLGYRFEL